jgi:hypothetical protein
MSILTVITEEQQQRIASFLEAVPELTCGVGNKERMCSVAAINLALTGELTDNAPLCMSRVIAAWIIEVQDAMPKELRNSQRWRSLLPYAAGTGRDFEKARMEIVVDWMWDSVLPFVQADANTHGFGKEWEFMLSKRTASAAKDARIAAETASQNYKCDTTGVVVTPNWIFCRDYIVYLADTAEVAARERKNASANVSQFAIDRCAVVATKNVAAIVRYTSAPKALQGYWETLDPCGLLERLIKLK